MVVQGPRLAGATSTLAQAAQTHLAGHRVLAFGDDPRLAVGQMVADGRRWAADGPGAVLWLDDLTPAQLGQLDSGLLDDLPSAMWILATVHDKHLKGFRVPEHVRAQLEEEAAIVELGSISGRERDALRDEAAYTALQPVLDTGGDLLMGRLMVALDQIQNVLTPGRSEESTDQIALLRAVTDWYRVAMPTLLTRPVLKDLYSAYRRRIAGQDHGRPLSTTRFGRVLTWATTKASRERPQLVDLEEIGRSIRYDPYPLLAVVADEAGQPGSWPVADALWEYADRVLKGNQRRDIGYTALDRGAYPQARRLLGHNDAKVEPAALHLVAKRLEQTGEVDAARRWCEKVVAGTDPTWIPHVMVDLGLLEKGQGNLDQARHWWERAIATGHADEAPRAMVNLGVLEQRQSNLDQARHWWERAIATGHADQAPRAMVNLGTLESEQGNTDQARRWYTDVIETSHPDQAPLAMANLGTLEFEQGNVDQARHWLGRAIASGHADAGPQAMADLGFLESEQGNLDQARRWLERVIATDHADEAPLAMYNFGVLERRQGNLDQARHWWERAVATGHADAGPRAMVNLGGVEAEQGNLDGARCWGEQTIATGHPDAGPQAMLNLGGLEASQGNLGQARGWWEQAVATGHPVWASEAMLDLGSLEASQGNLRQARRWWEQAVATGHRDIAAKADRELQDLKRHDEERRRAEHFGRYGWQAYADPKLMKSGDTRPDPDQTAADEEKPSPQ